MIEGDIINMDKMINMLLQKLSTKYDVFYLEKRTYRNGELFKSFEVKIGNSKEKFNRKTDLLYFLKNF